MAGHRSPGQTLVAVPLSEELLAELDAARERVGEARSAFIRKSIVEKLQALGHDVDLRLASAPDRAKTVKRPNKGKALRVIDGPADLENPPGAVRAGKRARNAGSGGVA